MTRSRTFLTLACLFLATSVNANVTLPAIFNDHMVLQQNSDIKIWGWGKPLENVTVIASWDRQPIETVADNHANWSVMIKTPAAGGPHSLTIRGYNTVVIEDVLIGEVWLCSGQSNMEWSPGAGIKSAGEEIPNAIYPEIRLFQVTHRSAEYPQQDCRGEWSVCHPQTVEYFSAIAYFFGRDLFENLNVPIGLVHSSWGGTPAEAWMNAGVVMNNEKLAAGAAKLTDVPWCPVEPGSAYNAMLAPLIPFEIAGVIWYQGEANTSNPIDYRDMFPALIKDWRTEWGKEFPFYYVQIAPYKYGTPNVGALVREAQMMAMSVPKTGMVVVSDIGNIDDIHPKNKRDVGKRLANWALSQTYGKQGIAFSGPIFREMKVEKKKALIYFDYADQGLVCKGDALSEFEIAARDSVFVPADAKIDGKTVVVSAKDVDHPVAVRFAWSNTAEPNLFNKAGLPASSFRTDDWPLK